MRASFLAILLLGCSTASSSTAPPSDLTIDDFATQLAAAICDDAAACCKPIAGCTAAVEKKIRDANTPVVTYDGKLAATCVSTYRATAKCTDRATASAAPRVCQGVLDGKKNPGEGCTTPEECKRGSLGFDNERGFVGCGEPKMGDPKVCIAFRPTGDADAACNEDLPGTGFERVLCKSGLACIGGVCKKAPAVGEACPDGRCSAGVCDMSVCKKLPGIGEACAGACADNASCTAMMCVKAPDIIPFACIGFACPSDGVCM